MNTVALDTRTLSFPTEDLKLVKEVAKKFGWSLGRKKKCGLDEAIEDVKAGRVEEIKDIDEFFRKL